VLHWKFHRYLFIYLQLSLCK